MSDKTFRKLAEQLVQHATRDTMGVDGRAAVIAEAVADERDRCCKAIRAACGECKGTGRRNRVDDEGCEYPAYCDCEKWFAAIRKADA